MMKNTLESTLARFNMRDIYTVYERVDFSPLRI
jgi:hypothetical protein